MISVVIMQDGKMNWKLLIVFCVVFSSCVAKKKVVDKSKSTVKTIERIDSSQLFVDSLTLITRFDGFTVNEFTKAVSWLDWQYIGSQNDSFSISIKEDQGGYTVSAVGTGTASGGHTYTKELESILIQMQSRYDSLVVSFNQLKKEVDLNHSEVHATKAVNKRAIGIPAGAYIVIGIFSLLLILFLLFRFTR